MVPPRLVLVIHERRGHWARHLRPRLVDQPVRLIETRSGADLQEALFGAVCPIVLIDVSGRPRGGLDELERVVETAPDALVLVLDAENHPELPAAARQLGATHVLSGPVPPPLVADWVRRWLPVALPRALASGGNRPAAVAEPELWDLA